MTEFLSQKVVNPSSKPHSLELQNKIWLGKGPLHSNTFTQHSIHSALFHLFHVVLQLAQNWDEVNFCRITRHSEKVHRFYLYRCKEIFELFHRPFSCCLTVSSIRIDIRSEGCNDPGKTPNTCGRAYIKVNGNEHSKKKRGHNVVVLDAITGKVLK